MDTMPGGISERDERLGAIVFAYLQALERGRPLDQREVLARHPEFAAELAEFFADRADLQQLAAPLREVARAARPPLNIDRDQAVDEDTAAWPGSPLPGTQARQFGDHELLAVIGRGGNGVVYKARQLSLNRVVALKMIPAGQLASWVDRQRFHNEAEAVAELDHPHIVPIYEHGEHAGYPYFSMKLIDGGSLAERIAACRTRAEPGLPSRAAARLLAVVARAVHHAHRHGILHRDLKPANILLARTPDGEDEPRSQDHPPPEEDGLGIPYVTDFSLAKRVGGESTLTRSGDLLGTPRYMAPEQVAGRRDAVTTATDVYGLGAILYAMLTGRPPFQGDTVLETLEQVKERAPEPPSRLDRRVDRDLETICLKCLDKDPQRRYASAEALALDLERWLAGEPIRARRAGVRERAVKWARRRPAIAALGGLVVLVAATGLGGVGWQWRRAVSALDAAEAHLYTNRIVLADRHRRAHDADRADELLGDCPVALRDWEWRYLMRRSFEDVTTYPDHDGPVQSVALSPDGRYLVAVDIGQTVHVRDRATGRVLDLPSRSDYYSTVALSPDGRLMAVGGDRGSPDAGVIRLWSTAGWSELKAFSFEGRMPHALAFSPDSRRLVAGQDDRVRVWDVATGTQRILTGHTKTVEDASFSPDGRQIASASQDATIRIWDADTYEPRMTLPHGRPVFSLAFHPGGHLLASATGDLFDSSRGDLALWDLGAARVVRKTSDLAAMIRKVRFSPNGRRLATAGWDRVVRIWDAATLDELLPLTGHGGLIRCIAFSRDGDLLVSGGDEGSILCWNAAPLPDPPRHRPVRTIAGHERPIFALGLTGDGHQLVSTGEDHTARVWEVETGHEVFAYREHRHPILALAVRPDGTAVATASDSDDRVIRLWDPRTGAALGRLRGHEGAITALAFHPDGVRLASACNKGTVRLWDTRTGEHLHLFLKLPIWVYAVAFTPDGRRLAAAGEDGMIHVWDTSDRRLLHVLRGHTQRVVALAFHPDSVHLASASLDGTVRVWDSLSQTEERLFDGARGRGLAWSPDGQLLATSGAGGTLKVWERGSGRRVLTLQGHADDLTAAVFTPDGRRLITAGWDGAIQLWDTLPDTPGLGPGEARRLVGHPSFVARVAPLPDGKRAVSGGDDRTIRVWDIASGRERRRWIGSEENIYAVAPTPDGRRVLSAGTKPLIRIWEIDSGREVGRLEGHREAVFALAVLPDGRRALSGSGNVFDGAWKSGTDLDLILWDLDSAEQIRRFRGHRGGILCLAISPDGRRAASASQDGTARVWDLDTGAEVSRFEGHQNLVTCVAFLPDGRRLLSGGHDQHLRLWDVETGREIRRFDGPRRVDSLVISPDGRRAVSGEGHYLRVWDLATGRERYHYEVPHAWLTNGVLSRDGRQAIWAAFDGALRVWDVPEQFTREPGSDPGKP